MEVRLPVGNYIRLVQPTFTAEQLSEIIARFDYVFAVSKTPFPQKPEIEVLPKRSAILPIFKDEEAQIAIYKATCRNEVRRSYRTPELTVEVNTTDAEERYAFHRLCEEERGWKPVPPEELISSLAICVRYKEELIAGMSAYVGLDTLRVGRIFSRRRSERYEDIQKVVFSMAARRVVHELTRWGATQGLSYLDLGGIALEDESKKGITRFKLYFGAEVVPVFLGRIKGAGYKALENYCKMYNYDLT